MITYRGILNRTRQGGFLVTKSNNDGNNTILSPEPSQKLINHSPDGFAWGYDGSGPAQLALGLLLDVTEDSHIALRYYQDFKWDIISRLIMTLPWNLDKGEIELWLTTREEENKLSGLQKQLL